MLTSQATLLATEAKLLASQSNMLAEDAKPLTSKYNLLKKQDIWHVDMQLYSTSWGARLYTMVLQEYPD